MPAMGLVEMFVTGDTRGARFDAACEQATADELAAVLALLAHPSAEVRWNLAANLAFLSCGDDPTAEMIQVGIALSRDADTRVRDWACMCLAQHWREIDTVGLRTALADRLDDPDRDTRCEALVGLAYRGDPRALPRVRAALSRPDGDLYRLELVAAGALGDPTLHDLLFRHQDGWDEETTRVAAAALRVTDPAGPDDDVLNGVAELYRRRAHNRPDGDAILAWQILGEMLDLVPDRAQAYFDAVERRLGDDDLAVHELRDNSALATLVADGAAPSPGVAQPGGDPVDRE
jgi:hypothetical protein